MVNRRQFLLGSTALAFAGLSYSVMSGVRLQPEFYKGLYSDPKGLFDLPEGFTYRVISELGQVMTDGMEVPDRADGMGCIALDEHRIALIRNHELHPKHLSKQPQSWQTYRTAKAYDVLSDGVAIPGGTTTIIYNTQTGKIEREFVSLTGTIRNCAGGVTPWGTWLSCEETVIRAEDGFSRDHGYIFEVPASAEEPVTPIPLKDMGRFNHEAASVDPHTGYVYLTEDRHDSLFYRFIPNEYGNLAAGGQLQALVIKDQPQFDTRNWKTDKMPLSSEYRVEWINISGPESPNDDLRYQGYAKGAAVFARGEGIHWGDGECYFCCTNGGAKKYGQIMRYTPSAKHPEQGVLQLIFESHDKDLYEFGDNLTVTPQGHLLVCEDKSGDANDNHLRWITPDGHVSPFARLNLETELAGACFAPDGNTLFVNVYSPTKTLAITGPWAEFLNTSRQVD
jgi:secreted PhoX family phosphatase